MRLPCPFCGERGIEEFSYFGDATRTRPGGNARVEAWIDYVYFRDNPEGPHRELWLHASACRRVLVVERDTRTHAILSAGFAA